MHARLDRGAVVLGATRDARDARKCPALVPPYHKFRFHLPPADSLSLAGFRPPTSESRAFPAGVRGGTSSGRERPAWCGDVAPMGGNISVGPNFSTAARMGAVS